jgi:crotonobetaine/carnitine-CoA ligase
MASMTTPTPDAAPWGRSDLPIGALLDQRAATDADFTFCRFEDLRITVGALVDSVNRAAHALKALGIAPGVRVSVMLPNHPDYLVVFFALMKLGVCQVPVNVHLRGEGLRYILSHASAKAMIVDARYAAEVDPILPELGALTVIWRGRPGAGADLADILAHAEATPFPCAMTPDDPAAISYTSGTTGLPKGVVLTDRMLRVSAHAAARLADVRDGDVFYLWEPLYHIGGAEVLILGLQERVTIAMVERFSVSRFWREVRAVGATHIHFLGGVLALLLKEPPRPDDKEHPVRLAWGGGCPVTVWRAFEERFGIPIRECYGMTESSSFTTQNLDGKLGSVGKALPWFEVSIVDDEGRPLGPDERGEIVVRERVPGLIMQGYFNNPQATAEALRDGALFTGDIGWRDADGYYYFAGRKKDSIRRRGENITAFEIERVANEHPMVAESGVVGVPNELSDEDIKIFLKLKPGAALDPLDFIRWCEGRLAYFQVPRYVAFIDAFPKTPSERIRKDALPRSTEGIFDLERSGYRLRRG